MTYLPSPWPNKRSIGACYCLDQAPSAELWVGLTITLAPREETTGKIVAHGSDRVTKQPLKETLLRELAAWAEEGMRAAADELGVDLAEFDIEFSDFTFHPTDSRPSTYSEAAASAFRAAWDGWQRFYRDR